MKKIFVLLCMVLYNLYCFAADYRVIKDSKLYDGNYYYRGNIKKGTLVQLWDTFISDGTNLSGNIVDFDYCCTINWYGKERLIDLEAIVPAATKDLFDPDIVTTSLRKNGKYWTYVEDCDVLFSRDRKTYYEKNKAAIEYYEQEVRGSYDGPWYENVTISPSAIYNVSITLNNDSRVMLLVKNIHKTANGYKVLTEVLKFDSFEYDASYKFIKETFIPKAEITLKIVRDGEYLHFYTEDGRTIISCALVDEEFATQYENLIQTNKCDLSRVTWPRHADGSCDYDGSKKAHTATKPAAISSTQTTNVAPNKTMTVKENLKLRSGEAATTSVLAVMSTGTKVKILALGKQATIDGITSNWVQVEVQAGAKDREGKSIAAGATGWCFGGYLE